MKERFDYWEVKDVDKALIALVILGFLAFIGYVQFALGFWSGIAYWLLVMKNKEE
jgi:hypothetical protein